VRRLGDDASRLLAAAGVPRLDELSAVTDAWPRCVGAAIARSAWPRRLARDGTLHVATVSSTWAFELDRLAGDICARLQEALGEDVAPRALRFAPGPVPEPPADDAKTVPRMASPTAESRSEGERIAAGIADDALRRLVARAAAASLDRARSDRHFC
jgi:hypothetical protein